MLFIFSNYKLLNLFNFSFLQDMAFVLVTTHAPAIHIGMA